MKNAFYFAISIVCFMTSCGGSKIEKENRNSISTNEEAIALPAAESASSTKNALLSKQISELEAQRNKICNQIQEEGDNYLASHPNASCEELTEVTKELIAKSKALKEEIDSLGAFLPAVQE